jgi:hypothetical protein
MKKAINFIVIMIIFSYITSLQAGLLPPSDLTASIGLTNQINVTWSKVSGATSYIVYRGIVNNTNETKIKGTISDMFGSSKITFTDFSWLDPKDSTAYYYWVKSQNSIEVSDWGNCVTGRYLYPTSTTDVNNIFYLPVSVTADYDGDKLADPAIYYPMTGTWCIRLSLMNYKTYELIGFGGTNYTASAVDFDGDGKADPTIFSSTEETWKTMLSKCDYKVFEIIKE